MTGPTPRFVVHPDKQVLADAVAARLVTALVDAQSEREIAELVLTGGSMGAATVAALARIPARAAVDWSRVQVWWGDERYLPSGNPDRNCTQCDDAGLMELGLDPALVHRVPGPDTSESTEDSAERYAATVRDHGTGPFDVVLLGVGPDAHVASLFPHHPAQTAGGTITVPVHDSPKPPADRVSLTFDALMRARQVWFLVSGAEKADAVAAAAAPGADRWDVPAAGVRGTDATLWLLDLAAAAALPGGTAGP
ncbi:6-phosphogluconolactonase [Actinotalea sp. M2MS4P-6]|uniref:6-phosphogluconolactonase n=1 Tax=Actinotalea sp. M2MS4P-6 TaxID=2983762 RepID=UPI0021E4D754|nr:6-phosphogluconolactonase [Actinotalea sp. M2MS4P-6]MCV2394687.1 6-phosphogluconolactonase [Actinotalea sp. M2MS4P-6]